MRRIHLDRPHALGLAKARRVADAWAARASDEYGLQFIVTESRSGDEFAFSGRGVHGRLMVTAERFVLHATLGPLTALFGRAIQAEIEKRLELQVSAAAGEAQPSRRPGRKA